MWKYVMLTIVLLLSACGGSAGSDQADNGPTAEPPGTGQTAEPPDNPTSALLQIDRIEAMVAESMPPQVFVQVQGVLPDSCTTLGETTQQRDGNTIEVTITTNRDPDAMCTLAIQDVEENIALEGEFSSGEYIIRVNGLEQTIQI